MALIGSAWTNLADLPMDSTFGLNVRDCDVRRVNSNSRLFRNPACRRCGCALDD